MPNSAKKSTVTRSHSSRGLQTSSSDILHMEYIFLGYDNNRMTTAQKLWLKAKIN